MRQDRLIPPLNALRAFEAAARHRSFTRAAEELNVTQTAVSHQVRQLENRLGFRLFRRLNNALVLTEKGEAYLPVLEQAFSLIAEGTRALHGTARRRTLTVSTLPNFALRWLIPRLAEFRTRHPEIELRLVTSYRGNDLLREEIDVAIRLKEDWPHLEDEPLFGSAMFPVCTPEYLRAHCLDEVSRLDAATLLQVSTSLDDWPMWAAEANWASKDIEAGPQFDSYALAVEAALCGMGVAMGRSPFVDDDLRAGRLVAPFMLRVSRDAHWHVTWLRGRLTRDAGLFRDWLLDRVARDAQSAPVPPDEKVVKLPRRLR